MGLQPAQPESQGSELACPMCGPFSSVNYWNYRKPDEQTVKQKLESAPTHLMFSLELGIRHTAVQSWQVLCFRAPRSCLLVDDPARPEGLEPRRRVLGQV